MSSQVTAAVEELEQLEVIESEDLKVGHAYHAFDFNTGDFT